MRDIAINALAQLVRLGVLAIACGVLIYVVGMPAWLVGLAVIVSVVA